jgi:tRNA A37 threonylcarbamoyladenosine biosynthesis protein TsaE
MSLETRLVGQEDTVAILNTVLHDPPHIFISGGYGSGKSTIVKEFLSAYYSEISKI